MAISRHFHPEFDFLLTWLRDEVDDDQLRRHILVLNDEENHRVAYRELADCRDVVEFGGLTVSGTVENARLETNKSDWRLAILITPDDTLRYGMARAFQMFAKDTHAAAEIFTDVGEALDWLADDEADRDSLARFVREVTRGREAGAD